MMFRKVLNFFGLLKKSDSCLEFGDGSVAMGKVHIVYDKDKKNASNTYHNWIPITYKKEELWIRLTENKFKEALGVAKRNPEDTPYEL